MAQYFPTYKAKEKDLEGLNRKLTKEEYEEVENYLYELELENGYIQELGEHEEEFVPKWTFGTFGDGSYRMNLSNNVDKW